MPEEPVQKWRRFRALQDTISVRWRKGLNARTTLIVLVILVPIITLYQVGVRAPSNYPTGDIVTIPEGVTLQEVGQMFEEQYVIANRHALRAAVVLFDGEQGVIAGDYLLKRQENVFQIARRIIAGDFGLEPIRIRIPEGATAAEMAGIYAEYLPRFHEERFLELARPLEGYLFPDTYFFLPNATEERVVRTMASNFAERVKEIEDEMRESGRPVGDVVTMASLLEKEAHIQRDRRMIAGVLWTRLDIGMPLQVDAAFLYILGRTTFDLTLADLQTDSPYNTYRYPGLPAGPIANPGLRSLQAAVTPIAHDYLFYLADYSGVTHYSETYEEHLRKKRIYLY
jgi:UPF0755 protein